jgi:hypothetical protein
MPAMTWPQAQVGGPNWALGDVRGRMTLSPHWPVLQKNRSPNSTAGRTPGELPVTVNRGGLPVTVLPRPNHL